MKHPIRHQLLMPLLAVLVTVVSSIAVSAAWLNWSRQVALHRERQDQVVAVLEHATFPLSTPVLQQMSRLSGQQFVVWNTAAASLEATSFTSEPVELARQLAESNQNEMKGPGVTVQLAGEDYSLRVIQLRSQPGLRVLVFTSLKLLAQARQDAIWPPLAFGGGALVLLVPWLLALTRGWSRRIEEIQKSVAEIANGNLARRVEIGERDDELSALMADIQRMSRRLQELQTELIQSERERLMAQMAAGFAHQFRNGVAGASLALQLHSSRCGMLHEKSLQVAQQQLGLLEAEIRGMLSLARRVESPRDCLAASELIESAVQLVMPAVEHRRITLRRNPIDTATIVHGTRDGLRAALLNLLLNAIDASGPGGEIRLDAEAVDGGLKIVVRDNGPGPSPDVATRMTDAFVTTKPEGIGLGLTIVAAVAKDHQGRLGWYRQNEWTVVELWLPTQHEEARVIDESSVGH